METANLNNLKRLESLGAFKSKIKGWRLKTNYPCRICKSYIYQVGFI